MMNYGSYRYTKAEVDLDKVSFNYKQMKEYVTDGTKIMSVIKADAYGHGAVEIGRHLETLNTDYLAVAVLDEAMELRDAGIRLPILLLSPIELDTIPTAIENDIAITVFSLESARAVNYYAEKTKTPVNVHVKVDSGMGRIGVRSKKEALELCKILSAPSIVLEGIFTHFAEAENTEDPDYTKEQFAFFMDVVTYLESQKVTFTFRHCSNTAASLLYPEFDLDMIRTGISIFGYHPDKSLETFIDLKPVMTLSTHAAMIKHVSKGDSIGYGRTYTAQKTETIATILLGYADGIPRELSNRWHLTHSNGAVHVPIVGRICMDQLMVNVTDIDNFSSDDQLVFIGDPEKGHPSIYKMADLTDSFHYEILCGIGKRVPRVYLKGNELEASQNVLLD